MEDEIKNQYVHFINNALSEEIRRFSLNMGVEFKVCDLTSDSIDVEIEAGNKKYSPLRTKEYEQKMMVYSIRNAIIERLGEGILVPNFNAKYFDKRMPGLERRYNSYFFKKEFEKDEYVPFVSQLDNSIKWILIGANKEISDVN